VGEIAMIRMRFKLSTLLMLPTFITVTAGLGTQIYLLRQQVAELKRDITRLNQSSAISLQTVFRQPSRQNQQNQKSPFHLLNNETTVNPAVEDGMKAGEWELKQRIEERRNRDEIPSPKTPDQRFEKIFRPLPQRSAN
jgi:hypothetical protein